MIKRLAIIPARSGSKRIKNKNIKIFCGEPIINYSIINLLNSKLFNKIHVSTDSERIKNIVEKKKIKVDFLRPKNLALDTTPTIDVIKYVYSEFKKLNLIFDEIWTVNPCCPLITHKELIKASKDFAKSNKKLPLISSTEYPAPIEWAYFKNERNILLPLKKNNLFKRSQNFKKKYYEVGAFIIFPKVFFDSANYSSKNFIPFNLPREKSVDIDTIEDWKFAEKLYKLQFNVK